MQYSRIDAWCGGSYKYNKYMTNDKKREMMDVRMCKEISHQDASQDVEEVLDFAPQGHL